MSGRRVETEVIHAYHDRELGWFARWRAQRRLERDPAARAELARLAEIRAAVHDAVDAVPVPDLWPGIEARLRTAGDGVVGASPDAAPPGARLRGWLRPLVAGAAAAAAAIAWLVFSAPTEAVDGGVVRWLYTRGRPVMVLDRPGDATIIWLLDETPGDQTGRRVAGVYI